MRKAYKRKRGFCVLCKPHKLGWSLRWKPAEAARRFKVKLECRHPSNDVR